MGLIDQAQERKNPFEKRVATKTGDESSKILQASALISVANKVLDLNSLPAKSKKRFSDCRTRLGDASWLLHQLLGNVDEAIWSNMVGCAIEGQEKTIQHSQPNGTWKVVDYEVDIRRDKANNERLYLVAKWIDVDNQQDLHYQNGAPSVNLNISAPELPKELIAALSTKGGNDEELKGLLKELIGAMANKPQPSQPKVEFPPNFDDIIPE